MKIFHLNERISTITPYIVSMNAATSIRNTMKTILHLPFCRSLSALFLLAATKKRKLTIKALFIVNTYFFFLHFPGSFAATKKQEQKERIYEF